MIPLDDFVHEWDGKGIDFDHAYGFQCVDLVQQYNKECLGFPPFTGNAIDIWTTYPKDSYDQIPNTPQNFPSKGDIVIWGSAIGIFGHIDVCAADGATTGNFTGFDQNWPLGSVCHIQAHTYFGVLGWLHPKDPVVPPETPTPTNGGDTMNDDQKNALAVLQPLVDNNQFGNLEGAAVGALTDLISERAKSASIQGLLDTCNASVPLSSATIGQLVQQIFVKLSGK